MEGAAAPFPEVPVGAAVPAVTPGVTVPDPDVPVGACETCADFISREKTPEVECCWKLLDESEGFEGALVPNAQTIPALDELISKKPEFVQLVAFVNLSCALNKEEVKLLDKTWMPGPEYTSGWKWPLHINPVQTKEVRPRKGTKRR